MDGQEVRRVALIDPSYIKDYSLSILLVISGVDKSLFIRCEAK